MYDNLCSRPLNDCASEMRDYQMDTEWGESFEHDILQYNYHQMKPINYNFKIYCNT